VNRKPSAVPQPTIAPQIHQALDVHGYFGPQFTFDFVFVDHFADVVDLTIGQMIRLCPGFDIQFIENLVRCAAPYSVDIGQSNFDPFSLG
jgi:hypothetical protein